jgi:hypothetical protein
MLSIYGNANSGNEARTIGFHPNSKTGNKLVGLMLGISEMIMMKKNEMTKKNKISAVRPIVATPD